MKPVDPESLSLIEITIDGPIEIRDESTGHQFLIFNNNQEQKMCAVEPHELLAIDFLLDGFHENAYLPTSGQAMLSLAEAFDTSPVRIVMDGCEGDIPRFFISWAHANGNKSTQRVNLEIALSIHLISQCQLFVTQETWEVLHEVEGMNSVAGNDEPNFFF